MPLNAVDFIRRSAALVSFWSAGRCLRGSSCTFRHSNAFEEHSEVALCRLWLSSGFCKFGADCSFRHTGDRFGWRTGTEIRGESPLLEALPDELLALVVAFLPLRDRLRLRAACRRLAAVVHAAEAALDSAALGLLPSRPALLRSFVDRFPSLTAMDLRGCETALSTPCLLAVARASPQLEVLRVAGTREAAARSRMECAACIAINNAPARALEGAAESLAASLASRISATVRATAHRRPPRPGTRGSKWSPEETPDAAAARIASVARSMRFGALRELEICFTDGLGGPALASLLGAAAAGGALQTVSLRGEPCLTDEALSALARASPHLQRLDVSFCVRLTDAAPRALAAACPALETLALAWCPCLTDEAAAAFLAHPALRRFDATGARGIGAPALDRLAASKPPLEASRAPAASAAGPGSGKARGGVDVARDQGRPRLTVGQGPLGPDTIATLFDVLFQSISDIDELFTYEDAPALGALGGVGFVDLHAYGDEDEDEADDSNDEYAFEGDPDVWHEYD
eukprot:tig00020685_g12967.t1